jgi:hypothetical protein
VLAETSEPAASFNRVYPAAMGRLASRAPKPPASTWFELAGPAAGLRLLIEEDSAW